MNQARTRISARRSARLFLFSDDEEARNWRAYWTAVAGLPPEAIAHAYQWLHREHPSRWWEDQMTTPTTAATKPCEYVLYMTSQQRTDPVPVRCIALAVPGSPYCTVHQPYREQVARLTQRRLRTEA